MAAILLAVACGGSPDPAEWAAEAEAWHDALIEAQIAQGGGAFARFLSPDAVWDHRANYSDHHQVHRGEDAIKQAAQLLGPESARLGSEIFINVDGLVSFYFYDYAPLGLDYWPETKEPQHDVSLMAPIGPLGVKSFINGTAIEDWQEMSRWPGTNKQWNTQPRPSCGVS